MKCRDCKFFHIRTYTNNGIEQKVSSSRGTCHFHAPRPSFNPVDVVCWPPVEAHDPECGNFVACVEDTQF